MGDGCTDPKLIFENILFLSITFTIRSLYVRGRKPKLKYVRGRK